jgi:hypothetical protein
MEQTIGRASAEGALLDVLAQDACALLIAAAEKSAALVATVRRLASVVVVMVVLMLVLVRHGVSILVTEVLMTHGHAPECLRSSRETTQRRKITGALSTI